MKEETFQKLTKHEEKISEVEGEIRILREEKRIRESGFILVK